MQEPLITLRSRAKRDFADCVRFIAKQPWGNPEARKQDIREAMEMIRKAPEWRRVEFIRHGGVGLRRRSAAAVDPSTERLMNDFDCVCVCVCDFED
jgi:hypothetical protein